MSKTKKLFADVKNNPQNVRFDDICKMAEYFGFKYKAGKEVIRFTVKKVFSRY